MLTRTLTAFALAATPQVPTPTCKLAGPPAEAHWSGAIPPASPAEAPLRAVADVSTRSVIADGVAGGVQVATRSEAQKPTSMSFAIVVVTVG